jgi:hypothetical protein
MVFHIDEALASLKYFQSLIQEDERSQQKCNLDDAILPFSKDHGPGFRSEDVNDKNGLINLLLTDRKELVV